ncbi:uncharacterized protein LOC129769302 [Toxorhynchites rutilus septentrionalis]|uniref:uncharacterized protein LOC129769302 n=1 Tax=Toxorhynchites rutilus septentrionalis TaxID=329112 RepID=UPI00247B139D|nr:uncharacterized protein LOC129769302 [Toxorhynchites rutilus septentrionalis]
MFWTPHNSFVFIYCSSYLSFVLGLVQNNAFTIKCMIDMLNQCPPNSSCDEGLCICLSHFQQNPAFNEHERKDFCIIQQTSVATPTANKSVTFNMVFKESPDAHHILGGILIPVFAVLVILATIVLTKKLQLLQKVRQMLFSSRARRPAYEDVVLVGYEQ